MGFIKILSFAVFLTLSLAALTHDQSISICNDSQNKLQRFDQAFNKPPRSVAQQEYAEQALTQNCNQILSAPANATFERSLNAHSDLLITDLAGAKLHFGPSQGLNDSAVTDTAQTSFADQVVSTAKKLVGSTSCPSNYKSLSSSVKDQGSCGSCWTFSTAAALESAYNRVNNEILDLSEQYILECLNSYNVSATPQSTCSGGILDYALQMIVNTGLPLETTYPYAGYSYGSGNSVPNTISNCASTSNFKQVKFPTNNSNALWYRYDNLTSSSIEKLLNRGTLVVAIYADSTFMSYSSGVFSCPDNFDTAYGSINHAVELVGMDCNGNYIIKNSWGTSWGESGYATISASNDCAMSAYVYSILFEQQLSLFWLGMLLLLGLLL